MKIVAIHEATLPIGTAMRNASIAFDQMTASALVIRTDQSMGGQALVGLAFDSIGRYDVRVRLWDVVRSQDLGAMSYTVVTGDLRLASHRISHSGRSLMARLTLDKTNKKILGVCAGLANWTGIDAMIIRLIFAVATVVGVGSPVLIYILLALILD